MRNICKSFPYFYREFTVFFLLQIVHKNLIISSILQLDSCSKVISAEKAKAVETEKRYLQSLKCFKFCCLSVCWCVYNMRKHLLLETKKMPILIRPFLGVASFLSYSAGLSPRSSHDTSLTSRASSAEAVPAHLAPYSTKRMDREFERKLQEVFVSVQLEKVRKIYTCLLLTRWSVSASSVLQDGIRAMMIFLRSQQFSTSINNNLILQRPIWSYTTGR